MAQEDPKLGFFGYGASQSQLIHAFWGKFTLVERGGFASAEPNLVFQRVEKLSNQLKLLNEFSPAIILARFTSQVPIVSFSSQKHELDILSLVHFPVILAHVVWIYLPNVSEDVVRVLKFKQRNKR